MPTTGDVVRAPRNRHLPEWDHYCRACGSPLVELRSRIVPVFVHARHRDWASHPHPADPRPDFR